MSGLRPLANAGAFGVGPTPPAVLPIAAGGGRIIVVAAIESGNRFGSEPHREVLNGVSDSGGNTYTEIAAYAGQLGYPISPPDVAQPWSGWVYAHLKIFEAIGTLPVGGTVTLDADRVDSDSSGASFFVWDGVGLTGPAVGSTGEVEQPTVSGVLTTVPAAGGLPVTLTGSNASYATASAAWGGGSVAAWCEGGASAGFGEIDNVAEYAFYEGVKPHVAWTPTPSNPHLQMQIRTYLADENVDVPG